MTTDLSPEFTTSLRGYDRIQVDDYVDTLREWLDAATARMQASEADAAQLRDQMLRLRQRLAELEADAGQQPPRSLTALGERVAGILALADEGAQAALANAEAAATDIVIKAQQDADELIRATRARQVEAEAWLAQTTRQADQLVAQAEERAGLAAAQLTSEAGNRAAATQAQAEQRAHDLVAQAEADSVRTLDAARAERARTLQDLAAKREELSTHIRGLEAQRDEVLAALTSLRESLHRTIGQLPSSLPATAVDQAAAEHSPPALEAATQDATTQNLGASEASTQETAPEMTSGWAPPAPTGGHPSDATQAMAADDRRPDDTRLFDQNEAQEAAGGQ